jgi:hypothetical protein
MPKPGSATDRGYGVAHQKQRRAWEPKVRRGEAECHAVKCLQPTRAIAPNGEFHMGHTPDRTRWTGPEHPGCNTHEGAVRGNAARKGLRHSRVW